MLSGLRNLLVAQLLLVGAVVVGAYFWGGIPYTMAALFGGAIVLMNSLLLGRRMQRAEQLPGDRVALAMYAGAVQRFVLAALGFALGMGLLALAPLPMLAAFAAGQLAYPIAAHRTAA